MKMITIVRGWDPASTYRSDPAKLEAVYFNGRFRFMREIRDPLWTNIFAARRFIRAVERALTPRVKRPNLGVAERYYDPRDVDTALGPETRHPIEAMETFTIVYEWEWGSGFALFAQHGAEVERVKADPARFEAVFRNGNYIGLRALSNKWPVIDMRQILTGRGFVRGEHVAPRSAQG